MKYSIITTAYNQLELLKKALPYWRGQSFGPLGKNFEWVIGDDGSDDGVIEWCKANGIKIATQPHQGYRFTEACKIAIEKAEGDYLVFVAGDCYPHPDFLNQIDLAMEDQRIVNGVRIQVDAEGTILESDWRVQRMQQLGVDMFQPLIFINQFPNPWELMTLTSMAIGRKQYLQMGGLYAGYNEGYGKMDWDLAANGFYQNMDLVWAPKAVLYHQKHPERVDTDNSTKVFIERLQQFQVNKGEKLFAGPQIPVKINNNLPL